MDLSLFGSPFFTWVGIPLLIALARVVDVTLGTIRIIYISRGMKLFAPSSGSSKSSYGWSRSARSCKT